MVPRHRAQKRHSSDHLSKALAVFVGIDLTDHLIAAQICQRRNEDRSSPILPNSLNPHRQRWRRFRSQFRECGWMKHSKLAATASSPANTGRFPVANAAWVMPCELPFSNLTA